MPSARTDKMYKELLEIYRESKYSNPELSLNYDIETLIDEGKSRERAIFAIYRRMTKRLGLSKEAETYAERRIKELEKELNELRLSARSHAEEVEAIKKYLAYTHRLTTSQTLGRICFYLIGAALVILSFFQYRAVTIYIRVATGFEWVWILNCFVTLILGIATIALGWVLESMARINPTF